MAQVNAILNSTLSNEVTRTTGIKSLFMLRAFKIFSFYPELYTLHTFIQ